MKIKIKKVFGYTAGVVLDIQIDPSGIPLDQFWRKRLKDAATDGCVEVVKASKKSHKESPK